MDMITAQMLVARLDGPDGPFVLDVREPDEFEAWRIPGAVNIPLGSLAGRLAEVPKGREVVAVCAVGARAATAVDRLASAGYDAEALEGGMGAWATVFDDAEIDVDSAQVVQIRRRGKGCLSYMVAAGGAAVVIDPSADIAQYTDRAAARGWTLSHVVDTHLHADHVSGARMLAEASGAVLVLNPADPFHFGFTPLHDGMHIAIGDDVALRVSVLSTPGHTMGSTALVLGESAIFTGDTLFLESVGRPDLADRAEEFAHELYTSLHDKVLTLPDGALVLPAHFSELVEVHAGAVVGEPLGSLRARLWQLDADEDTFVAWATRSVTDRPPNYVAIVAANQGGVPMDTSARLELEAGPNRCAVTG